MSQTKEKQSVALSEPLPLPQELYGGIIRGDFEPRLGVLGHILQIVCTFIPVVGTVCGLRDFLACRRHHDGWGSFWNLWAMIPVFGVIPKTIIVLIHSRKAFRSARSQPRTVS